MVRELESINLIFRGTTIQIECLPNGKYKIPDLSQFLVNDYGPLTWLDDCRIPYSSDSDKESFKTGFDPQDRDNSISHNWSKYPDSFKTKPEINQKGRFPANLLVSDDVLNDGKITKSSPHLHDHKKDTLVYGNGKGLGIRSEYSNYNDEGSYSRYFDLDKWWYSQFLIVPKASKSERNKGTDEKGNFHATVKPLKLMSYLITMGSREGDLVLDPFMGSGTVPIAAEMLHRQYVGIEINPEYFKIAQARLNPYLEQTKIL